MKFPVFSFHQLLTNKPELNSKSVTNVKIPPTRRRGFSLGVCWQVFHREQGIITLKWSFINPALLIRCKVQYSASSFHIYELNVPSCGNSCILQCSTCPCILKAIPISEANVNPPFHYLSLMLLRYCIFANLMHYFVVPVHVAKSTSLRLDTTISNQAYPVNYLPSVINNDRWTLLITCLPRCFQMNSPWSVLQLCHIYCYSFPLLSG